MTGVGSAGAPGAAGERQRGVGAPTATASLPVGSTGRARSAERARDYGHRRVKVVLVQ